MFQLLHQYLIQYKSLYLPGLGTMQLEHIPAINNFTEQIIEPPSMKAVLHESQGTPDKNLFRYLAAYQNVEEGEAVRLLNDFVFSLKADLKSGKLIFWDRLGTLKQDADNGRIEFEALAVTNKYMHPIPARRIIRSDVNHTILRGDTEVSEKFVPEVHQRQSPTVHRRSNFFWWAIILLIVGIAYLIYHFYVYGINMDSLFNKQ